MKQKILLIGSSLAIVVTLISFGRYVFGVDFTASAAMAKATINTASIVVLNDQIETLKDTVVVNNLGFKAELKAVQIFVGQNNSILRQIAEELEVKVIIP